MTLYNAELRSCFRRTIRLALPLPHHQAEVLNVNKMVNITHVDLLALATSYHYNYQIQDIANASTNHISFISYSDVFVNQVLGPNPAQELVSPTNLGWEPFHEAGVYNIKTGKLWVSLS